MRAILGLLLALAGAPLFALDASNVLVVANEDAEGSVEIAEYYAGLRGIPAAQILKIKASDKEEITREEFNTDIWQPVSEHVLAHDNILVIVPTRGVPLKVKETDRSNDASVKDGFFGGRDFASVDGELALIRQGEYEIEGAFENPYFESSEALNFDHKILAVARLDGPTVEVAKGLVEKAILAEAMGCGGESFLDTRGPNLSGGYKQRDDIMLKVGDAWQTGGIEYAHDTDPKVLDLSTRDETLHYYGWYAGTQKPKGEVKFRTGGICIHLHSFSAGTVRQDNKNWVGPLLSWNCTATYGTVYEPLTVGFPYENVFWDRILKGFSFGEAGQMANRLLSWQAVFVGDPLYTPYPDGYAETHKKHRQAVAAALAPVDDAVPVDTGDLPLFDACRELLEARADDLKTLVRKDPKTALRAFNDLRFLVKDMELGPWVGTLSDPFNRELKARLDAIKEGIKDDLTDTAELEAALNDWKGLPIHDDLVALKEEVAADHEDAAAKLLKKAEFDLARERWLRAYLNAREAAAHKFAASAGRADEIVKEIEGNDAAVAEMTEEADKDLRRTVDRVEREVERERWDRAEKYLGREWRYYPDCDNRKKLAEFDAKIRDGLAKGD